MQESVLVAMSGGVDSSAAALLLKQQGYRVGGATFLMYDGCPENNVADAKAVCERLGIPHVVLDYRALFKENVLDPFAACYQRGQTPNPCVMCNRHIKFGAFCEDARRLGYGKIATGHYARVVWDGQAGLYQLWKSKNQKKDQSYVLYHLSQQQLGMLLLPLEDIEKEQVRLLAEEAGLAVSQKPDSQDICFIPDGDYAGFIARYTGKAGKPGDFIDEQGKVLGQHQGVMHYTIGQRRGLGIALGVKRTVSRIDPEKNTVTLSDDSAVFSRVLFAGEVHMIDEKVPEKPAACQAKIRYAHRPAPAQVFSLPDGRVRVEFDEAQRAATPGQAVVFYDGEQVLGGGTILPMG